MGEKTITISLLVLLLVASVFLSLAEKKQHFSSAKNSRWEVYLEDPKGQNMIFAIKNNGRTENFSWKLRTTDGQIKEDKKRISAGKSLVINPEISPTDPSGKISLEIYDENNNVKEIYKIFD